MKIIATDTKNRVYESVVCLRSGSWRWRHDGTIKSKSRLFFIEILIIIVFFSICAGVCMNLFATAKLISVESSI